MRKEKLVLFILMAAFVVSSYAQNFEEQREERVKIFKASKKKNKDKAMILSEEDAEQLLNDGWKTTPSALPLERQMDPCVLCKWNMTPNCFPLMLWQKRIASIKITMRRKTVLLNLQSLFSLKKSNQKYCSK